MRAIKAVGVVLALLAGGGLAAAAQNGTSGSGTSGPAAAPMVSPGAPATQNPDINPSAAGTQLRSPNRRAPGESDAGPSSYALSPSDKNPYTPAQARQLIEQRGYRQVTGLRLDRNKIWQAGATRDGQPVRVGVDARGIVAEE